MRSGELRQVCGFEPLGGERIVPSKDAYSLLLKKLVKKREEIEEMFDQLIEELKSYLPDLGNHLAIDSKKLESYARGRKNPEESSDPEAAWGYKRCHGTRADGSLWEKVVSWFGYKLHLLVDTMYELPAGYRVTKATRADIKEMVPMVKEAQGKHFGRKIKTLSGDKAYDSGFHNEVLYDEHGIKPVIDIRNHWNDGEETRLVDPEKADNIVYDYQGRVYCHCPVSDKRYEMAFYGFEKDRNSLKYRCPSQVYGMKCRGYARCSRRRKGRIVRIPFDTDWRIFVPIAGCSYKWERIYGGRTAVERVNSRIDVSFGFEEHFVRGKGEDEAEGGNGHDRDAVHGAGQG